MFFDGIDLTRFIDIRNISTSLAAPVTTGFQTFDRYDGARFDHSSFGQLLVTIKFSVRNNTLDVLDTLNRILHTDEPKVLYSEDRPDRYLMAMYTGESDMNRRYYGTTSTLTFISEDSYWRSFVGEKTYDMDIFGRFLVTNNGTAPVVPNFEFKFLEESGYLGIIAPNGFITLGDKEEQDRINLPKQELLINEEMDEASMSDTGTEDKNPDKDWLPISNGYNYISVTPEGETIPMKGDWIPDYNKLNIGSGVKWHDQWGMRIKKAKSPKPGSYWNTYGYERRVAAGIDRSQYAIKTNWRLESRLTFYDASGGNANTGMFLIVVFDVRNRPILTTSIYNILDNSNEVTMTAKTNASATGSSTSSKIVKTAKFPNGFDGLIKMETSANGYVYWSWNSNRDQKVTTTTNSLEKFNVGNTGYIRKDAKYGYGYDGVRHNIQSFTRGRPYYIQATRTWSGKKQYLISYQGVQIYWMNEGDLTANKSGVGKTATKYTTDAKQNVNHVLYAPHLTKMQAQKVVVIGGTWDATGAFTNASLNSVKMYKLNGDNSWLEINNGFQPDDILTVDNKTGEILLNGAPYSGLVDYDSKFFDIDYGDSELQVVTSSWSRLPKGKIKFEERFR